MYGWIPLPETITTLLSGYIQIQNKKLKKKLFLDVRKRVYPALILPGRGRSLGSARSLWWHPMVGCRYRWWEWGFQLPMERVLTPSWHRGILRSQTLASLPSPHLPESSPDNSQCFSPLSRKKRPKCGLHPLYTTWTAFPWGLCLARVENCVEAVSPCREDHLGVPSSPTPIWTLSLTAQPQAVRTQLLARGKDWELDEKTVVHLSI